MATLPVNRAAALAPLTHHEMLALVEPFVRAGHRPDLAGSDRAQRRVVFRPRSCAPHQGVAGQSPDGADAGAAAGSASAAGQPALPPLAETLTLELPEPGLCRLLRDVRTPDGLQARLELEGARPAELLQRLQALPPARQFRAVEGTLIALSQRLDAPARDGTPARPVLRGAQAGVGGLNLVARVSGVGGYPAELELLRGDGPSPRLPDDLLAVLGGPWSHLTELKRGWIGSIALRGEEPRRSALADERLQLTVAHLARTLGEPPARFHERHRGARWRAGLRGTLPLLVGAAVVGAALVAQRLGPEGQSTLAMLANATPPLLLMLLFLRKEIPRIGLPRVPRPPSPDAWGPGGGRGG
jgi:hypothetical protein